jgi:phosphoribosylformylglycinamidine synthase
MNAVPCREDGMTPYEMMLSESQERMLAILKPGREHVAKAIMEKWDLDFAVIGRTTQTGRMVLRFDGAVVCDIPVAPLSEDAPNYDRPWVAPPEPAPLGDLPAPDDLRGAALKLLSCPDSASKRWLWEQYDRHVMADTLADSATGADAAIVRVHGTRKALAITTDCTPRYVAADPFVGGLQTVAEAWRNLTAVGATPIAVTDNLNFGNPERPAIMGQIVRAIEGMAQACRALDFPVVSGNVSLYNETNGVAIPPTPAIGGVGLLADYGARAGFGLKAGMQLILVGETNGWLGASLYAREVAGLEAGAPPPVDLATEKRNGDAIRKLIEAGVVSVCHDLSDGGLWLAAAELALSSGVGIALVPPTDVALHAALFGEDQARYLIAVAPDKADAVFDALEAAGVPAAPAGTSGGCELAVQGGFAVDLDLLRQTHENWMPEYMEGR